MATPCPNCQSTHILKNGFYTRKSDQKRIQRYLCGCCGKDFSEQRFRHDYRQRKRDLNQSIFRLLCKGTSQRACAVLVGLNRKTIDRRLKRFGAVARAHLMADQEQVQYSQILVDEMESFIHTKCKPVTMPIAVEDGTRKIIAVAVGQIAAKGPLAAIARKRYGKRKCERSKVLDRVFSRLASCCYPGVFVRSDQSPHYPRRVTKFLGGIHETSKGRRGCVVGQGEMKAGGFDPLFSLNHTYAMIRDNVKRLSRRTWCTSKREDRLEDFLYLYAYFHNKYLEGVTKIILQRSPIPI